MAAPSAFAAASRKASPLLLRPLDVGRLVHEGAGRVPDPIEFVLSDRYLGKRTLYPRQGTMLKIIFLRTDMMTDYDLEVIGEWEDTFLRTGNEGISPGIMDRIKINQDAGRKWFREVLGVIGRRGGKGHLGALSGSYITWDYMNLPGGPQAYYGIDPEKRLTALVFGSKKEQAIANQWSDLVNAITGAACFQPYISRDQAQRLTLHTPADLIKMQQRALEGVESDKDQASIEILPSATTATAGRGPASYCLDPSTPVLMADLTWRRIEDVRAGEAVVGLDEFPEKGKQRKLREAVVEKVWETTKPGVRLTFDDGTSVVCSEDHKWLKRVVGSAGNYVWAETRRLKVGHDIRHLMDPWVEDDSRGAGYLAGFFDGEGSVPDFSASARRAGSEIFFSQNPGPVLDHVQDLLSERGFISVRRGQGAYPGAGRLCQQWSLSGVYQTMRFLGQIHPHRLYANHRRVWLGVSMRSGITPSGRHMYPGHKKIVDIERLPEQRLIDIQTSTRTFIAAGLVSHNCQFYDEMGHMVKTGAGVDAAGVYAAATPALDQFGRDGFIYAGSSPWQMNGQLWDSAQQAIQMEDGKPVFPASLLVQLPSWGPYEDWNVAHQIGLAPSRKTYIDIVIDGQPTVQEREVARTYPQIKSPVQQYDDDMRLLERANPETFAVERRSRWAASLNAYLDDRKIKAAFHGGRMAERGPLSTYYAAHGDPAKINDNFGYAIGHALPPDPDSTHGLPRVRFDLIRSWRAQDFDPDQDGVRKIDYPLVQAEIERDIERFTIDHLTFDQFNCLPADTLVSTARGLIPIRELAGDLDVGATVPMEEIVPVMGGTAPTGAIHRKGPARVLRLRTKHGQVLECTPEHRVYVRPAKAKAWDPTPEWVWTTADQVRPGDHVRLALGHGGGQDDLDLREHITYPTRRNQGTPPARMTPALASVMGALVAEGSGDGTYFRLSNSDLMFTETFCDRVYEAFGMWPSVVDAGVPTDRWAQRYQVNVPRFAARFMHTIGLSADLSQGKVVPWSILRSGQRDRAAFLAALFEGDGGVTDAKGKGEWVHLTTTSQRLARQVSLMLHEMGILTTVWEGDYRYQGQTRRQWRVKVFGPDLLTFRRQVGFLTERKNDALDAVCAKILDRGDRAGMRDRNARFEDHYVDRVVAVEDGGVQDCYDLSVPGEENFVASGVVVHNSIQIIGNLNTFVQDRGFPKRIQIYERTATANSNWREAEVFKAALNLNLIEFPTTDADGRESPDLELLELELRFLEEKNGKVDHPSSGPVQTKDIADAVMAVTYHLIGEQLGAFLSKALGAATTGAAFGGQRANPVPQAPSDPAAALGALMDVHGGMRGGFDPSRGRLR